jgi:hypothetical protein
MTTNPVAIDAADEKAAGIFPMPVSGTISKIIWRTGTVTTGATVDVRLETVSSTDGNPSGTLVATDANGAQAVLLPEDDTLFKTALTTAVAVTAGDMLAVVVVNPAVSPGNIQVCRTVAGYASSSSAYSSLFTASWIKNAAQLMFGFEMLNGSIVVPQSSYFVGSSGLANTSVAAGNQRGVRMLMPFAGRMGAVTAVISQSGSRGNIQFKVYRASDVETAAAATNVVDEDLAASTSSAGTYTYPLTAQLDFAKGEELYVVLQPSVAAISLYNWHVDTASDMDGNLVGGSALYAAARTGPTGAFSTTTTQRPMMGIVITAMDDGTGAGRAGLSIGI